MESSLSHQNGPNRMAGEPAFLANPAISNRTAILFWIFTALFCLEMSFTAYYELTNHGMQAFTRLGFPNENFRFELSLAKLVGVVALLMPVKLTPINTWMKEWAYAGFAINLVSAAIAHLSISDRAWAFVPSMLTSVLWAVSYFTWRRLLAIRQN